MIEDLKSQSSLPIAVLISGSGRSLRNLIERMKAGTLNVDIRLVVGSNGTAQGLDFAREANIDVAVVRRSRLPSDEAFSDEVFQAIRAAGVQYVVMAGFLKYLPIPADFENRVINIHPALIPECCGKGYYGKHVHEAVIEGGSTVSGCTVHFVDNEYDHGPIILQRAVRVRSHDTAEELAARVFEAELEALPETLNLLAAGRIRVKGTEVEIVS